MPGFIDAHKHINTGPNEKEQMQSLLEAGYTTVWRAAARATAALPLRDHIESGMINGPRVLPSERINLRGTPEEARAAVRAMAAKGIKHTGEIALTPGARTDPAGDRGPQGGRRRGRQGGRAGKRSLGEFDGDGRGVDAGVRRLVHLPNKDLDESRGGGESGVDEFDLCWG